MGVTVVLAISWFFCLYKLFIYLDAFVIQKSATYINHQLYNFRIDLFWIWSNVII